MHPSLDGAQYGRPSRHYKLYLSALFGCCPHAVNRPQLSVSELMADRPLHKSKTAIGSTIAPNSDSELPTAYVLSKM